jgi:hypothetical protein
MKVGHTFLSEKDDETSKLIKHQFKKIIETSPKKLNPSKNPFSQKRRRRYCKNSLKQKQSIVIETIKPSKNRILHERSSHYIPVRCKITHIHTHTRQRKR